MKLCEDCKHHLEAEPSPVTRWVNPERARCAAPGSQWGQSLCLEMRDRLYPCGPEGKLFKAR